MNLFGNIFRKDGKQDDPALHAAIARAINMVEPQLKHARGYPGRYREPVSAALQYATRLAASVPGPFTIDRGAYAREALVHALFPDSSEIAVAIASSLALQEYLSESPAGKEVYALMGMRRIEKNILGMDLAGETLQRDILQQAIYFTSHTIDNPSASEAQTRTAIAARFFDCLVCKVGKRIAKRKQDKSAVESEKDLTLARLRTAQGQERQLLEKRLAGLMNDLNGAAVALELRHYAADFEAVMLHPELHLHIDQQTITLDSMGIRRAEDDNERGKEIPFSELVGYDRRDWVVALVRLVNLQNETFSEKLDKAYRQLAP